MLDAAAIQSYRSEGYAVFPGLLAAEAVELGRVADEIAAGARGLESHTALYDLEDSHRPDAPRVRRIKNPHRHAPSFAAIARHPKLIEILQALVSENVRIDTSKLNLKSPGYGAAIEWHQDCAFDPHTNTDLAAIGIFLDAVGPENGPLLVVPGSHKGPIYDHHSGGCFCGAIDIAREKPPIQDAIALTGPVGTVSIHHCRMLHGSALNRSDRPRRILFNEYAAGDAWPIARTLDIETYRCQFVCGVPTMTPRLEPIPVRLPLPPAPKQGSIYEIQKGLGRRYFETDIREGN